MAQWFEVSLRMIFGRELELTALDAAYADTLAGQGSVLFLTGEAGLGKTTLVHAWAARRDAQPSTLFLESACSIPIGNVDVGRLEALQPWADVVAQLHEKLAAESTSKSKSPHKLDLGKLMRDSAPAWLWALPFVGEVAHAALVTTRLARDQRAGHTSQPATPAIPTTAPAHVHDERQYAAANQEQVFQQYVNLLTKIAEATPLVIFLDDLHWADTSSCNLLFYLARELASKKILVVATYRPDEAAGAEDGKGHAILKIKNEILRYSAGKELVLSYLNRDAIRAFLEKTFAGYTTDEKFEAWLHKISDGNSLFMTQFVRTLREDGHLDDQGKFVGDYGTVVIPISALAVVEERTRRLSTDMRKLLMYATAEGEEFTTYVLERLTKMDPMALFDELHSATAMGLIAQRGTGRLYANATTGIFGFSHALFHKALYNALLDVQKQFLHEQCFRLLKSEWDRLADTKQRTTTLATKLITHATKCEEWETVAGVALAAAQEFWKTFNEAEALAMIGRVLDASDALNASEALNATDVPEGGIAQRVSSRLTPERAEALFLRGKIGVLRDRYNEATADYTAAEDLFESAGIVHRVVDVVNQLTWTQIQTASYDTALAEAERALMESGPIGHLQGEAAALNNIGIVHRELGNEHEALSYYERSLAINIAIGNGQGEAHALNNIGNLHGNRGDYLEALSYYERSLPIRTAIGDRQGEAVALSNIGVVHSAHGAYDDALSYHERSLTINSAIGSRRGEARALQNIGIVHKNRGAYDDALPCLERSLAIVSVIGNRREEANTLDYIGHIHASLGAYDEALFFYDRSLANNIAIGNRRGEANSLGHIGHTHRLSGKFSEARSFLEKSLAIATAISDRAIAAEGTAELGLLAETEARTHVGVDHDEKLAEAQLLIEEALVVFRELKLHKEISEWEKDLARIKASA